MQGLLAYIFLFYATLPYLLVVACLVAGTMETLALLILSFCSMVYTAITLLVWVELLSLNRTKGPVFGGIYASRLAEYFEIPIRHEEK